MKKINTKGFTLIELLAVITIMGILMMVAIPAVSRTIENSRRDTFMNVAKEYVSAVRNGMLADNIECQTATTVAAASSGETPKYVTASALYGGSYYFPICSSEEVSSDCDSYMVQSTKDLMESGGNSPFGGSDLIGYVEAVITVNEDTGYNSSTYSILLADAGNHGFAKPFDEKNIKRQSVLLKDAIKSIKPIALDADGKVKKDGDGTPLTKENTYPCRLSS